MKYYVKAALDEREYRRLRAIGERECVSESELATIALVALLDEFNKFHSAGRRVPLEFWPTSPAKDA